LFTGIESTSQLLIGFPGTHRGKERFPGMTITYALIQMLEKVLHF
jgi:hypothetical protein